MVELEEVAEEVSKDAPEEEVDEEEASSGPKPVSALLRVRSARVLSWGRNLN